MKLHPGAHTGASELVLAPACGHLLWHGQFSCAQLLGHLLVPHHLGMLQQQHVTLYPSSLLSVYKVGQLIL